MDRALPELDGCKWLVKNKKVTVLYDLCKTI